MMKMENNFRNVSDIKMTRMVGPKRMTTLSFINGTAEVCISILDDLKLYKGT